jgi:two-component system sensor histidine kinase BaeS
MLAISDLQTPPCRMADDYALRMLQHLQNRFEARVRAAGLSLQVLQPPDVATLKVCWDAGRIEQLLANPLEKICVIPMLPGEIRIRLEHARNNIIWIVEDSSPGVSSDQIDQIFEPLYHSDLARSSGTGGSNLGLAICQAIAKAHGGTLSALASALGGLTMTLVLPKTPGAILSTFSESGA